MDSNILYIGLAAVGVALLLIGTFANELIDIDGFPLTMSLGAALTVFGGMSLLLGGNTQGAPYISAGAGLASLLIVGFTAKHLQKSEYTGRVVDFEKLYGAHVRQDWWNEETNSGVVLVELSGDVVRVNANAEEPLLRSDAKKIKKFQTSGETLTQVTVEKA